ncbi:MAG: aspartate kinase [Verrucomicrobia bacterium]|nr:aspartate kinase [Verrucomicrobiota bacterium]
MQDLLVVKFGGAALKNLEGFIRAAKVVEERSKKFSKLIVVVSAMGDMTDRLLGLCKKISDNPPKREQDMLISAGERISMALLAMVFADSGCEAISFTGSQAGIITCQTHTDAKIIAVRPRRLLEALNLGKIVIVAGFQGVSEKGDITTLGRGGSDTTAVALAIALKAERVEFYKDVPGIFESDPKLDPSAEKLSKINYQKALTVIEKSERKVLHPRAVRLAEKNGLLLHVHSFQEEGEGSIVVDETIERSLVPYYEEVCEGNHSFSL